MGLFVPEPFIRHQQGKSLFKTNTAFYGASTNLLTNGGIETNVTGWAGFGTNTVAKSSDFARFGTSSLKCTVVDTAEPRLAFFNITLTAVLHTYSAWIYIPSAWDGGTIQLRQTNFTGSSGDATVNADMNIRNAWQRLRMSFTPASGDLSGRVELIANATGATSGKVIYIDGVQVEVGTATPYIETDGATNTRGAGRVSLAA